MNYINFQEAFDLVKEFYDHAWTGLLAVTGIVFGLVGVVCPMLINYIQVKENKSRLQNLEKKHKEQKKKLKDIGIDSKIALGGIYLHQGNLQIHEYMLYGDESELTPIDAYLSYLKALNIFLDVSIPKHIDTAFDQLAEISNNFTFSKEDMKHCPELEGVYYQVIRKLEKNKKKDIGFYSDILFYLNNKFDTIKDPDRLI